MRCQFLIGLLLGVTAHTFGQNLAKKAQPVRSNMVINITDYERLVKHFRYYKPDSATYYARQGIVFAQNHNDRNGLALMLTQLGMIDDNQGKFDESKAKYNQALRLFQQVGSQRGIATATIRLGVVDLRNGKYDTATDKFLKALKLSEARQDSFGIMEATYNISWAYLDQHNYESSLHYLNLAEQVNKRLPLSNISLNIYNNYGVTYREKKEFEKAVYYLKKGISLSGAIEYQGLNITLINNLATVYAKQGRRDKAIALQEKALIRSRAIHNYLRELQSLAGLAKTYGTENPQKAIFYFQQAVLLAREKGVPKQEMRYLKEITNLYKSQGAYQDAFLMKEREHVLADSFYYHNMSQHIVTLKSEYELGRSKAKVKELSFLNTENQLKLEKSTIIRNVTFGGLLLVLLILGLLYNQYRIKQAGNQLLEAKQIEINQKNKSLQQLLGEKEELLVEKEWMMKEIHHRVKNNLQIITSMLNAQFDFLHDPTALAAIRESQNRVHAMALIHQKLYQSEQLAQVNMADYIDEIVDYLLESFSLPKLIQTRLDVANIALNVNVATPIGLIINESVTNSLKYAFPDAAISYRRAGQIEISLQPLDAQRYRLLVADDGVGMPVGFDTEHSSTLGLTMIQGLSRQIGGQLTIGQYGGVKIQLDFNPIKKLDRSSVKAV